MNLTMEDFSDIKLSYIGRFENSSCRQCNKHFRAPEKAFPSFSGTGRQGQIIPICSSCVDKNNKQHGNLEWVFVTKGDWSIENVLDGNQKFEIVGTKDFNDYQEARNRELFD